MNLERVLLEKKDAYNSYVIQVGNELMEKFNIPTSPYDSAEYTMTEHQVLKAVLLHIDINIQYTQNDTILEFWKDVRKYVYENYTK